MLNGGTPAVPNGHLTIEHSLGASPPPPPPNSLATYVTPSRVFNACWTMALVAVMSGWLTLPAKDSELKILAGEVASMGATLKEVSLEMRGLRNEAQRNREEFIRFTASGYETAPAPVVVAPVAAPVVTRRYKRPAPPAH